MQVETVISMIHANDVLKDEGAHSKNRGAPVPESAVSPSVTDLGTRVSQLEDQVAILMATVPPATSIPAAQRLALERRGSSAGGSHPQSLATSRSSSRGSTPRRPSSSRVSSARGTHDVEHTY